MSEDPKDYHINGKPVSANELIAAAREAGWDPGPFQFTSEAADYLRRNSGCSIGPASDLARREPQ